ncbi:MAG: hypothetical protein Faunusvirus2_1, partial [Faunusvirus sp.]
PALIYACYRKLEKTTLEMINQDADLNVKMPGNVTLLIYACSSGMIAVVTELLKRSVDVNEESEYHISPLIEAARRQHEDIFIKLVDHGADITDGVMNYARENSNLLTYINNLKQRYRDAILHVMSDSVTPNNKMYESFATTYVPQLVGIICDFII